MQELDGHANVAHDLGSFCTHRIGVSDASQRSGGLGAATPLSPWTAQLATALLPSRTPIPHTPSHPNFLWGCPRLPEPLSLGLGYPSSGQLCGPHPRATESPYATRRYRLTGRLGVGTLRLTLSSSAGEREAPRGAGPRPASQSSSVAHLSAAPAPVQVRTHTYLSR